MTGDSMCCSGFVCRCFCRINLSFYPSILLKRKREIKSEKRNNFKLLLFRIIVYIYAIWQYKFMLQLVALLIILINSHKRFYQYGGYFTYFAKIIWVQSRSKGFIFSLAPTGLFVNAFLQSICPINFTKGVLFNHALYGILASLISQSHLVASNMSYNRIR